MQQRFASKYLEKNDSSVILQLGKKIGSFEIESTANGNLEYDCAWSVSTEFIKCFWKG